jgi:hypothetical protein
MLEAKVQGRHHNRRAACAAVPQSRRSLRGSETKSTAKRLKRLEVSLDGATIKMALNLGDGDLSLGVRRAVVLASKR